MRKEWREYWYYFVVKSYNVLWCVPVSLIFFLGRLPDTPKELWLRTFGISLGFGFIIAASIWFLYSLIWALIVHVQVKTGILREPKLTGQMLIGLCGTIIGCYLALRWKAWVLDRPFSNENVWNTLAVGAFVNVAFVFFYAYRETRNENLSLQEKSAEANFRALKAQMQPHFLFNSLNSLSELIEADKDRAAEMTQKLADLYRQILENSKVKTASLSSEISIARNYLELEKLRFGERLKFIIHEPENCDSVYVPSLMLQTLVENAVKHGISKSVSGGEVEIEVKRSADGGCAVHVINSGEAFSEGAGGTGLANTRSRLNLLYGSKSNFEIFSAASITIARFQMPGDLLV